MTTQNKDKIIYNVFKNDDDICLHRTLKGAKECQKIRGGSILKELVDKQLCEEIDE